MKTNNKIYQVPAVESVHISLQAGYASSVNLEGGWKDSINEFEFGED